MEWEYKTIVMVHGSLSLLNKLGKQGWELVGFMANVAFLKRPIIPEKQDTGPI